MWCALASHGPQPRSTTATRALSFLGLVLTQIIQISQPNCSGTASPSPEAPGCAGNRQCRGSWKRVSGDVAWPCRVAQAAWLGGDKLPCAGAAGGPLCWAWSSASCRAAQGRCALRVTRTAGMAEVLPLRSPLPRGPHRRPQHPCHIQAGHLLLPLLPRPSWMPLWGIKNTTAHQDPSQRSKVHQWLCQTLPSPVKPLKTTSKQASY